MSYLKYQNDAVKVLHSICQQIWKTAVATGLEKVFSSNPKEGQCQEMFKLLHNCTHLTCQQSKAQNSPGQASTVHELRTSRCLSWIQKKQRNRRSNFLTSVGSQERQENSRKSSTFASLIMLKPLTMWITTNVENSSKDGNTRPPYLSLEKPVGRSRSNSQNQTWNNTLLPNLEKSMSRLYIVTLLI